MRIRKYSAHVPVSDELVFDHVDRATRNNCGVLRDGGGFWRMPCFIHTRYSARCAGDVATIVREEALGRGRAMD